MREGIMQGGEHLTGDKYSLLIGAIDTDLVGNDVSDGGSHGRIILDLPLKYKKIARIFLSKNDLSFRILSLY
mgnify:CR=1 FL=1